MSLSAFSLPSFAGGIAGVASGLLFCFRGGFPRDPLSEFRIAGLLLGFQGGLTSGSLGGQISSLTSFNGQLSGCSLSNTGIARHPDRLPRRSLLDSGRALGRRPRSGRPLQLGLFRICSCAQAVGETGVLGPTHLIQYAQGGCPRQCRFQQQRGSWKLRGPAIRKLFDLLIKRTDPRRQPGHTVRGPKHVRIRQHARPHGNYRRSAWFQPPLAASLYSESLTCVPQAAP